MKYIFLLMPFIYFTSKGQNVTPSGAANQIIYNRGGMSADSLLAIPLFSDTSAANNYGSTYRKKGKLIFASNSVWFNNGVSWSNAYQFTQEEAEKLIELSQDNYIPLDFKRFYDTAYDYQIVSVTSDSVEKELYLDLRNGTPPEYPSVPPRNNGVGQMKFLFTYPLMQHVGVVLIGNSITWGMSATGRNSENPRSGNLADRRNNDTSKSWANLFHKWIGKEYYSDDTVTASASVGVPAGVNIFEYEKKVDLFPAYQYFTSGNYSSNPLKGSWQILTGVGSRMGYVWNAGVQYNNDDYRMSFTMTGYEFDLIFASLPLGCRYEYYVNGTLIDTFSTNTGDLGVPTQFGNVRTHTLGGYKKDAVVEFRVISGDVARTTFRIESITINRKLRITNQGIVGTTAKNYLNFVNNAITEGDNIAIVSLGVNDRLQQAASGQARGVSSYIHNMNLLCDSIELRGVLPVLMCENAVTSDEFPLYYFDMSEVRAAMYNIARSRGYSFIDIYAKSAGKIPTGLADGIHPNDLGFNDYFFLNLQEAFYRAQ